MHKVLVNHVGGLSLPRKSVVRLTDCLERTIDVYRGCKTTQHIMLSYPLSGEFCSRYMIKAISPPVAVPSGSDLFAIPSRYIYSAVHISHRIK